MNPPAENEKPVSKQSLPGTVDLPVMPAAKMRIWNIRRAISIKGSIRLGVGTFFFTQGLCFASWASRIPDIKNLLSLSDAGLGSVLFALPAGSIAGLPLSGWVVGRLGSKRVLLFGALVYVLAMVSIGLVSATWQLVASLFCFGVTGNLVNIAVNTQAIGVENIYKKSIMASFHGAWSLAGFSGATLGTVLVSNRVPPLLHFLSVAVFCYVAIFVAHRFTLRGNISSGSQPFFAKPDNALLALGVIGFCGMACEGAMFDWSGVYFQKVVNAPMTMTTVGYVAFMSTMSGGRFAGDWLANLIGRKKMLQLSGIFISAGLMVSVLFPFIVPVTIGFLLVGFGVSSVVPLVYSAAGKSPTMSPSMALAAVSTISFFGFLIGPPLIGFIAEEASLRYSFAVIAALGLGTTILSSKAKLIQ
jgi:MFS family permease